MWVEPTPGHRIYFQDAGVAYIYTSAAGGFITFGGAKADNPGVGDLFGSSVGIHNGIAVVGAPNEQSASSGVSGDGSDDSLDYAGAAYVFRSEGDTGITWPQLAYLKAPNPDWGDQFG